jgi:3-phenylpropionate/trans-cinnamate dioxygenase ferredoxin reductase subunit
MHMNRPGQPSDDREHAVVVVGAGHGGGTLVGLLRQSGHQGPIVLLGAEKHYPYHRPPLSKKFLGDAVRQLLRPEEFYEDIDVDVRLGVVVDSVDTAGRKVVCSDGVVLSYESLVVATGARPRKLALRGADLPGVLSLRDLEDAYALRDCLGRADGGLVIVGGGYIGLEVAAEARSHGLPVTVLEREDRVLARVASAEFSALLATFHSSRGTDIRTAVDVTGFVAGADGRVGGVELSDGTTIACDAVLVGVGAIPNDELAIGTDIAADAGILVDAAGRTTADHVYAIGDVTRRPTGDGHARFESIPSAVEQARQVAAAITGGGASEVEVPWFWSDQFDLKLKIAGRLGGETTAIVRGDPSTDKFAIFHVDRENTMVAAETANAPAFFMAGKKFITTGTPVDPFLLSDESVDLRNCAVTDTTR